MKYSHLLAACAAVLVACPAQAATLISAAVFGSTNNTIWATANAPGTTSGNYTLFLQNPGLGNFLNRNDEAISYAAHAGDNYAFLAGDGFFPGSTLNSDPLYRLELTFDNGAVLTGSYIPGSTNMFVGGNAVTIGNTTLSLTEFSFTRSLADTVGPYHAIPQTGDSNDYAGNFSFTQTIDPGVGAGLVPEPESWALMVGGLALVGYGLRRRRSRVAVTYA
ncbi:PEP-CTERM sorting domain-containing protein [Sphingomonas antarctica]|uniref:PEPxxWA-CTERM sorting domain-containing protein n=1 Tax=Sphingomonas antarctica TaxID=2040274 RepID=UPI0039E85B62